MIRKMLSFTLLIMFSALMVHATEEEGPKLKFEKDRHDYGTVYLDELPDTQLEIEFTNEGNKPLILNNVRACCGTRVTQWPREPIMPGEKGTINVEFRLAPRPHRISRTVTVHSNSEGNPTSVFRITGQVEARD